MGKSIHALRPKKVSRFNYQTGITRTKHIALSFSVLAFVFCLGTGVVFGQELLRPTQNDPQPIARESAATTVLESQLKNDQNLSEISDLNKQDPALEAKLNSLLGSFPEEQQWSVYVQDLDSTRSISINANKTYDSGSLYKLFLLAALEQKIPADKWESWWVTQSNVQYCVSAMISELDDEYCAKAIGNLVKWKTADEVNHNLGYGQTRLTETNPQTTARDVGSLLVNIKRGKLLSDLSRRTVFDALYELKASKGIASACQDCRTANKVAVGAKITHDAGIVTRGKKAYVVVIMSKGGSTAQIDKLAKAVDSELGRR